MRLNTNNHKSQSHKVTKSQGHRFKACVLVFCALVFICLFGLFCRSKSKPDAYIQKLRNGHYQLMVNRKPYIVKGVCYSPVPVGQNHEYDWWLDPNKPWITDGKLMKGMGINTIRVYQTGENHEAVKKVIKDLYELYGIRTILGSWVGFWEYPCPRYADKDFRDKVKAEILNMVKAYKDEPGVLMWILGNENNYSFSERVNPWSSQELDKISDVKKRCDLRAGIYYSFIGELTDEIHKIDFNHPVALGNGELVSLEQAAIACPGVDLIAIIVYRGKSFGNLFRSLKANFNKPVLISEFGADAYDAYLNRENQNMQAFFLESQWRQIYQNLANNKEGAGNCIGGVIFEWSDEWWKHNESDPLSWKVHDTESNWSNGSYYYDIKAKDNKNMNEEWFGIVSLSEELENGLNKRSPRKSYYVIREFWKNPGINSKAKPKKVK